MRTATWGRMGLVAAGLALAACGGGGGGSDRISLKSRTDVVREVANLTALYVEGGGSTSMASARSIGAKGLAGRTLAAREGRPSAKNATPKTTAACDTGSYTYDNFYGVARNLPLFAANPTVDYYAETNDSCRFVNGTYSELYTGRYEEGGNAAYTAGTVESPRYDYYTDGNGGTPFRLVIQDTAYDEKLTITTLGRVESRDTGAAFESREIFGADVSYAFSGESIKVSVDTGETGNPLVFVDNYGGDASFSIDGPVRYSSSACDGGALEYETLANLTFASDGMGTYISGGELAITSGAAGVTLVFESDGDVQYTLSGGGSGLVTRSEVASATGECVFTL